MKFYLLILISFFSLQNFAQVKKPVKSKSTKTTTAAPKPTPKQESKSTPAPVANKKVNSTTTNGTSCFSKKDLVVDLGVGFSGYGIPVHAAGEYFVTDDISAGLFANYSSYYSIGLIWAGAKGNYHFNRLLELKQNNIDIYGGLSLGYWHILESGYNYFGNSVFLSGQIGGRYFFNEKLGAFVELGAGNINGMTGGLSIKF